jgi:hypothetical protein
MAKFGMSLATLGHAGELKGEVGVNGTLLHCLHIRMKLTKLDGWGSKHFGHIR